MDLDSIFGNNIESAKLRDPGDKVKGEIVWLRAEQEQDYLTKQLKWFLARPATEKELEANGKATVWKFVKDNDITPEMREKLVDSESGWFLVPLQQVQIHLKTDSGVKRVFLNGDKLDAVKRALKEAGLRKPEVGQLLGLKYVSKQSNGKRVYDAVVEASQN